MNNLAKIKPDETDSQPQRQSIRALLRFIENKSFTNLSGNNISIDNYVNIFKENHLTSEFLIEAFRGKLISNDVKNKHAEDTLKAMEIIINALYRELITSGKLKPDATTQPPKSIAKAILDSASIQSWR